MAVARAGRGELDEMVKDRTGLGKNSLGRFQRRAVGRKSLRTGPALTPAPLPAGTVPGISRLMALAIHFDRLISSGAVADLASLARRFRVTRARMTQIMALNRLAPDLQEALLFLPRTVSGRAGITERDLRSVAAEVDWGRQRCRERLSGGVPVHPSPSAVGRMVDAEIAGRIHVRVFDADCGARAPDAFDAMAGEPQRGQRAAHRLEGPPLSRRPIVAVEPNEPRTNPNISRGDKRRGHAVLDVRLDAGGDLDGMGTDRGGIPFTEACEQRPVQRDGDGGPERIPKARRPRAITADGTDRIDQASAQDDLAPSGTIEIVAPHDEPVDDGPVPVDREAAELERAEPESHVGCLHDRHRGEQA